MNGPRFQRAADNAANNARLLLLVIYRIAIAVLFGVPALVYAARGEWIGAGALAAVGFAMASAASAD